MDPVKIEKFQAMKRHRRRRRQLLLFLPISLVQCMAAAAFILLLALFFVLSMPTWLSSLCSSLELLLFVSLPNLAAASSTPGCLFVLGNLIVVFLVGESKLLRSSSGANEEHMKKINTMSLNEEDFFLEENLLGGEEEGRGGVSGGSWDEEEEDDESLVELKKRSEDLIARVTEQWRVEARTVLLGYQKTTC